MTDPAAQEALPGLRATVSASRKAAATRARNAAAVPPAAVDPVARVVLQVPAAHLDRDYDYLVPEPMAELAVPGARVQVRLSGQSLDGFVLARLPASDHEGRLQPLRRAVSGERVLTPEIIALVDSLAERYAGTRGDLLRLAVPPRHARAEAARPAPSAPSPPLPAVDPSTWEWTWRPHVPAPAFLSHLAAGHSPRAVWSAAPGADWPAQLAAAVAACLSSGRGALICVPDGRDVTRVETAIEALLGPDQHITLTADAGPEARYRDFLAVARGTRRVVVGTRAAAFAPVPDLGLVVIWDDGDDLHAEPRAPYPHAREILLTRAEQQHTAAIIGGFARTVEAQHLVEQGWAHEIAAPRPVLRELVQVHVAGSSPAEQARGASGGRMPRAVYDAIRDGVTKGPVLVQTPRSGYLAALACVSCRTPARCRQCAGPLRLPGPTSAPECGWCGTPETTWQCPACGERGLRAPVVGETRTAEELGRAFPALRVRSSGGDRIIDEVSARPELVVATPGAEPVAAGGYAAVVLLDGWLALARPDLRTEEEALRRWLGAAGLCAAGGRVVVVADPDVRAVQALVRWDPAGFAVREAEQRASAHLPPATRLATVTGRPGALDDFLVLLDAPPGLDVLGPVPVEDDRARLVLRVPRVHGPALSAALGAAQRLRAARKLEPVRVQVDPVTL